MAWPPVWRSSRRWQRPPWSPSWQPPPPHDCQHKHGTRSASNTGQSNRESSESRLTADRLSLEDCVRWVGQAVWLYLAAAWLISAKTPESFLRLMCRSMSGQNIFSYSSPLAVLSPPCTCTAPQAKDPRRRHSAAAAARKGLANVAGMRQEHR